MKIRFANDYKTPGGRTYKAGAVHEIKDAAEARALIHRGKAVAATFHDRPVGQRPTGAKRKEAPADAAGATTPSATAETTPTPPAKGKGKE